MFDWLRRRIVEEKGYTMGFALGVALILTILGAALLEMVSHEMTMIRKHAEFTRAYYLAEAGINHALWNLNNNRSGAVGSETTQTVLGAGSYYTTYDSNTSLLTSLGTAGSVTRRIRVRTKQEELPLSLQRAVTAARSNEIPGTDNNPDAEVNVFMCNDTTETTMVVVCTNQGSLTIHGWVLNIRETTTSSNYLGYAYAPNGVRPTSNKYVAGVREYPIAQWKEKETYTPLGLPSFRTTSYEAEIRMASTIGTAGNTTWTGTYNLTGGEKRYFKGNLTINNATVTCDSTTTAATIVAYGNITIQDSTIGDAAGGKIKIIAGGGDDDRPSRSVDALIIEGNNNSRYTYLGKNIELYSNAQTKVNDHVFRLGEGLSSILLSRYELEIESDYGSGPSNYNIDLEGVVFSRERIRFQTEGGGRRIRIRGSIIAGDLQNPDGQLLFSNIKKQLWLIYDRGAIPKEGVESVFDAISGVTLDYTTWREG
ncbi:MAG TPA: hypothetical protein DCW86_01410 [Actinobacteria bacterium]|nr:hypothetical protein [Actinomycetota bacterium]